MENKKKKWEMQEEQKITKHDMYLTYKRESKIWDKIIDRNKRKNLQ